MGKVDYFMLTGVIFLGHKVSLSNWPIWTGGQIKITWFFKRAWIGSFILRCFWGFEIDDLPFLAFRANFIFSDTKVCSIYLFDLTNTSSLQDYLVILPSQSTCFTDRPKSTCKFVWEFLGSESHYTPNWSYKILLHQHDFQYLTAKSV